MNKFLILILGLLPFAIIAQEKEELTISKVSSIPDNSSINDILIIDTSVYVASSTGLYLIHSKTFETKQLREISCDALTKGSKNEIYASFDKRYLENISTEVKTNYNTPGIQIRDLQKYKGKVWIASNKGILTVNSKTNELSSSKSIKNSDLPSQDISFLHLDDQGQMWIGTDKGVVLINKKEKWKTYEKKHSMEAMHYNHEGLWLVSDKEMWVVDAYNRWYPAAIERGLREGRIGDITADSTGRLYMASDILVRYDPYNEEIESYKETTALVSKQCSTVESDADNSVWLGTANSGLYYFGFKNRSKEEELTAIPIIEKNIDCIGDQASVNLSVYGGSGPYSIKWNDGILNQKKRTLAAGAYEAIVTDATGKSISSKIDIQEATGMKVRVLETEQASSGEASNAKAKIQVSGGRPPYKISWENGERGASAFSLKNGFQKVVVTDNNNCLLSTDVEIKADLLLPELQIAKIKVGQKLQINNLFFQADSTDVMSESFNVLDEIYGFLVENETVVIEIGGHTNNLPSHEYCDKLSTARARSVAEYLYNKGITQDRISYKGYGKRKPIDTNRTAAGRKKNQRVEISILEFAG